MIFTGFIEWYDKGPVDLVSVDTSLYLDLVVSVDTKNNSEWE